MSQFLYRKPFFRPNSKLLNIFYANFRSVCNKVIDLNIKLEELKIDVLLGTETWLNTQYSNNQIIRTFQIHRRDRNSKGGGVLAAVRKGYKSLRRMEFESDIIEDIAIELIVNDIIILLITCYIPPNNTIDLSKCFEDKFKRFEIQFNQYSHVLIFGDFNVNFLPNNNGIVSKAAFDLKNIFSSFGFNQIIERYTYPTNSLSHNKKSLLDFRIQVFVI